MWVCATYSEVVESRVRQAASCYVFGQLVQHLWVLGLRHQRESNYEADKQHQYTTSATSQHTQADVHAGVLTCMASILRGMSSRCCLMLKCHVFILIMSSNINSRYRRPSTQTYTAGQREPGQRRVSHVRHVPKHLRVKNLCNAFFLEVLVVKD